MRAAVTHNARMPSLPCSVGLLCEQELCAARPGQRDAIIDHAIRARQVELIQLRETHRALHWHPLRTAKTALLSGLVIGGVAFLIAQAAMLGRWYTHLASTSVKIPLPMIGDRAISLGSYMSATSSLAWATHIPVYGAQESVLLAVAVVVLFLVEKLVLFIFRRQDARVMRERATEVEQEIAELEAWKVSSVDQSRGSAVGSTSHSSVA